MVKSKFFGIGALTAALIISGCGGGGSTPSSSSSNSTQIGYITDSAISNMPYVCSTSTGKTGSDGSFKYVKGKECKFMLGKYDQLVISGDTLDSRITSTFTPFDFEELKYDVNKTIRFMQFIQSVDGNTSDGIDMTFISYQYKNILQNFSNDTNLTNILSSLKSTASLVSASDAINHFKSTIESNQELVSFIDTKVDDIKKVVSDFNITYVESDNTSSTPLNNTYICENANPVNGECEDTPTLSGVAVDGTIDGATVFYNGYSAITNADGEWNLFINGELPTTFSLEASGGVDTSTGEIFEGTMRTVASSGQTNLVVSPLTTLVVAYMEDNENETVDSAKEKIASSLGLEKESLDLNPIVNITASESKKVLKRILQVQKLVESISKSASSDSAVSQKAFKEIAKNLLENGNSDDDLNVDEAFEKTIQNVAVITGESNEQNLANVKNVLSIVKNQIKTIDETSIQDTDSLKVISKSVEVITSKVEESLAEDNSSKALDIAKTVAITGISKVISQIESAEVSGEQNLDASTFSDNYFSDALIESSKEVYDDVENALKIASDLASIDEVIDRVARDGNTDLYTAISEVETEHDITIEVSTDLQTKIANIEDESDTLLADAKEQSSENISNNTQDTTEVCTEYNPITAECENFEIVENNTTEICTEYNPITGECENFEVVENNTTNEDTTTVCTEYNPITAECENFEIIENNMTTDNTSTCENINPITGGCEDVVDYNDSEDNTTSTDDNTTTEDTSTCQNVNPITGACEDETSGTVEDTCSNVNPITGECENTTTQEPTNNTPVADAGANQSVETGESVSLNGLSSSDADSDPLTYSWSITSKPTSSIAELSSYTSSTPSFTADVDGTYTITLIVNDGIVDSTADSVTITAS
ncbi:MAG: hypothetical protein JXQ66_02150, partial [Campylobacterales bacterium]|nr:hypothetical protein [Campylobacterales bacterium]